jgi:signal transduction histidine kinase
MALSVHHARAFLRTQQHDASWDKALRLGAWCWWLGLPLMAWFYSNWMRSALLYLGAGQSVLMLVLAVRTYRRYPRSYIAMYVAVWVVYLLSVAVYWLFRWFEWPLISTLGAQFVQGAMVAALLGWSGCMQVVQLRQDLQLRLQRHREQSRLYAAAQHDLWQPLQSMQLYAKSLAAASGQQQAHLLKGLYLASFYVDDFMHSLRHLADDKTRVLDADQLQAHSLADLLKDLLQEFTPMAQLRKVRLRSRISAQPVWVHSPTLLRMVRNMLSNALRHGASGGKILLGTRRQGDKMWLWCIDKGEGMSPTQRDACFKAFASSGQEQQIPQSLGLGLYSIKQLSVQMNTPVRLRSLAGKGTSIGVGLRLTAPRLT